ncbi:DUF998 domain-containing protein [Acholeplasma sp. OttesenSCG-928-E16]|nr:DUF998 domain-containing protein [Acholeplasma sp. OttesenSCG-928-E16]
MKEKNKDKIISVMCLSGVIAFIFYILHDIIGALNYPGYDWLSQAVSDLTAVGAPSRIIAGGLSSVYGVFSCMCLVLSCLYFCDKENKLFRLGIYLFTLMSFISSIGYNLFPLSESGTSGTTFQDIMHVYVITVLVVLLSITSLVLITIGGLRNKTNMFFTITAIIALILMMIGGIGFNIVPEEIKGLIERFSNYSAVIFTAIIGSYIFYQEIIKKKGLDSNEKRNS